MYKNHLFKNVFILLGLMLTLPSHAVTLINQDSRNDTWIAMYSTSDRSSCSGTKIIEGGFVKFPKEERLPIGINTSGRALVAAGFGGAVTRNAHIVNVNSENCKLKYDGSTFSPFIPGDATCDIVKCQN